MVEGYVEVDRPAADRTVLDESLPAPSAGVDGDVIDFETGRAGIGGIAFQWHSRAFVTGMIAPSGAEAARSPTVLSGASALAVPVTEHREAEAV